MNICITGGAGFIGSNSVDFFLKQGHEVTVIDNLSSGFMYNIEQHIDNKNFNFYEADIRDRKTIETIFKKHAFHTCIHFAALISVVESTENPILTEDINVTGMLNLLECGSENQIKTFVHASSAAVYGDSEELPKREKMVLHPKSPYAITKLAGEYYNSFFSSINNFRAINCRFFNVFGVKQNPDSQYAAAIPIFMKLAMQNKDITIYGDGEQVRDFIYVEDLVSAIAHLIDSAQTNENTYNLGYGKYISINELAKNIITEAKSSSKIKYAPERPGDIKLSYASIDNLLRTGWKPVVGFEEGIKRTVDWFQKII